jgi:hypothetical protein
MTDDDRQAQEGFMITFETTNQKEVRRFRIAQFNSRTATVRSGGSMVTGHVRSVVATESSIPPRWTITIVPTPPKAPRAIALRPTLRTHLFAEDYL